MANTLYRRIPSTGNPADWMKQDGGGPCYFKIAINPADGLWYTHFTYNGADWFIHSTSTTTPAAQQTLLDNYCAALNAGTA